FFHPALPDEPLIFVEVALVKGLCGSVQALLAGPPSEPSHPLDLPDTAIFYSISNCQEGLRGISFGNFLIKQVVEVLRAELPELKSFATLSAVPGFRNWLERALKSDALSRINWDPAEWRLLATVAGQGDGIIDKLRAALEIEDWPRDPKLSEALKPILLKLCALYL